MGDEMLKERLKKVPLQSGVYLFKNREGQVLYVGKARVLRQRMRSYFQAPEKMHPKVKAMMARVSDFDFIVTHTEMEALILENNLIKAYKPRYNIDLRDDKSYPYIKVSMADRFPRVYLAREKKDGMSRYFGPYTNVTSLRDTLKLLNAVFGLRSCRTMKSRRRPCLNRDMGKCLSPCSGEISEEEYGRRVEALITFLEGNFQEIVQEKEKEMTMAARNLEFEKAARLRDQIQSIRQLGEKQKIELASPCEFDLVGILSGERENLVLLFKIRSGKIVGKDTFWLNRPIQEDENEAMEFFIKQYYDENPDVPPEILLSHLPSDFKLLEAWLKSRIARRVELRVPQRGEKKQVLDMLLENARLLLEEKQREENTQNAALLHLSQVLDLEAVPDRLECFDVSHLGGEETVASMVVFSGGQPQKKAYRHFKIKTEQNNDTASLAEAVERRFQNARQANPAFLPEPDLILVDGGRGQVNAVAAVLKVMDIDIPLFGLAEKNEAIYRPGSAEPLLLAARDNGLQLLQRLRDEAHRFAIEYNRKRRSRKVRASALDGIPGIGEQRKKSLLAHFGSVARIKEASLDEIAAVPGMNRKAAGAVLDFFKESGLGVK
ncbi:MAG: excinuclease ABC subunit UvrC [Syntrophomonas sp.]|nr:excinuclease ABC subunit UvrC [Syntrophomonas sp.]